MLVRLDCTNRGAARYFFEVIMRFIVGIQARLGSTRLPNKILFPIMGKPILQHVVDNAKRMNIGDVVVLTDPESVSVITDNITDVDVRAKPGPVSDRYRYYHYDMLGEEDDIRYREMYYVRLCGDQPFVSAELTNRLIDRARETKADYVGYMVDGRPAALTAYGIYAEVFRADALRSSEPSDHVTNSLYMRPDKFHCEWIVAGSTLPPNVDGYVKDHPHRYSLTIDTVLDYYRIKDRGGWPEHPGGDPFKNDERYDWL
jgi:spore coat polysaccharide biosynthesis protein SpsF